MKKRNSPLSRVSFLATNFGSDSPTEKESTPEEIAERYWQSVILPTSQDQTSSSKQKEEPTNPSPSDTNSSNDT